jgi:hypothetical protein
VGSVIASYVVATVLMWMHASDPWELIGGVLFVWLVLAAIFWSAPHLLIGLSVVWLLVTAVLWLAQ